MRLTYNHHMPDWLAEPDPSLLLLVAVVTIGCVAAAWHTRKRLWLILAAIALVLVGLLFLCDRFFQSDREQIADSVQTMAAAVGPRNMDAVFQHISDRFRYGSADKAVFRRYCEQQSERYRVESLVVWNFEVMKMDEAKTRAEVSFQFKVKAGGRLGNLEQGFYRCIATYVKDADGKWRMQTFRVYPLSTADQELTIPGL